MSLGNRISGRTGGAAAHLSESGLGGQGEGLVA